MATLSLDKDALQPVIQKQRMELVAMRAAVEHMGAHAYFPRHFAHSTPRF